MSEWFDDVKKYDADASEEAVTKIEKHLGIALRSKDASLVSCSDASEKERVREQWLKKKLALGGSDTELDAAVDAVCDLMKADKTKTASPSTICARRTPASSSRCKTSSHGLTTKGRATWLDSKEK